MTTYAPVPDPAEYEVEKADLEPRGIHRIWCAVWVDDGDCDCWGGL